MKNKKPLISIIVPFYNVENYIFECIDSLVSQTYKNIEIILIDDASPDNSKEIIKEFLLNENVILIENSINKGLHVSRDIGYRRSKGDYIIWFDSDDFVNDTFIENNVKIISEFDLDIIQNNVIEVDENGNQISKGIIKNDYIFKNSKDYGKILKYPYGPWCKMYKREIVEKSNFSFTEEGELKLCLLSLQENIRMGITSKSIYFYRKHTSSMSSYKNSSKRLSKENNYSIDNINKKIEEFSSIEIKDKKKRKIKNIYLLRVNYFLALLSWSHTKYDNRKVKKIIKKNFKVSLMDLIRSFNNMTSETFIFLLMIKFKLDFIIKWKINRKIR